MFLTGFELIFFDGKMRNIGRENDDDAALKTITFLGRTPLLIWF